MLMVHNPWTMIQGDAPELKKQIEVLEKMKTSMVAVYRTKFDMVEDEISRMMDDETWISTEDIGKYKLRASVMEGTSRIAASISKSKFYARVKDHIMAEDKPTEETVETLRERIQELERENEELRRQLDAPEEDRVRGMQSRMQMQINAQKTEFENQLQARAAELTKAQAEVTSLRADLEKVKGELQTTASALDDKTRALAQLNAGVLTPNAATPAPKTRDEARRALARLPMDKRADYYNAHRSLIDG